jgi:hypothetical protein
MKSDRRTHISRAASELAEQARTEGLDFLAYLLEIAAREAGVPGDNVVNLNGPTAFADAAYLREQASRCVRLARQCRNLPISHDLEVIGVELMEKAAELEGYLAGKARAEGRQQA